MNNLSFKAVLDGKEREITVLKPNFTHQKEGQKVYNNVFNEAIKSGAMLRQELDKFMKERGIWDEKKQIELIELGQKISDNEKILEGGGIKLSRAVEAAKELKFNLRARVRSILAERYALEAHTAESQADDARFNYWVSACLVYSDNKKPVFKDIDDYYNRANEDYAVEGARKLMNLIYGLDEDVDSGNVENKFLREFKLADEKNRLINKEGKLVDQFGNVVDEDGFLVEDKIERKPFLDEDEKPIIAEEKTAQLAQEVVTQPVVSEPPVTST